MALYNFNTTNPVTIGAIPSPASVGELALTGLFDFPKRIGETEYDWGDGYEALVEADDIELADREVSFRVFIQGANAADLASKIEAFKNTCLASTTLTSSFGISLEIRLNKGITFTEDIRHHSAIGLAKFTVTNGLLPGVLGAASGGNGFLIDNYNFVADFGIYVQKRKDNKSISSVIDLDTTEKYISDINNRQPRNIQLNCLMQASNLDVLTQRMGRLHQLLALEGLRTLTFPDGSTHQVYCKDGLKVTKVYTMGGQSIAQFYFKLREPTPA
ncbi:hypothetical protein KDU71_07405 [Carboxylicivirga sediminis]|uniref:Uncharacterized protein n=1 Tax=Carboxylicivirga sediminis TaxID=2006564 RepID=A0A941F2Y7_9BACT|nr:hypothetical protein [Carboxylicivirga sediminis]MBR8535382.1 hypothetical protein [Carboxylicivirga sediminis]